MTTSWWSSLWLNEGFASYFEYLGADAVEPEWRMMETRFVVGDMHAAMHADAVDPTRPVRII